MDWRSQDPTVQVLHVVGNPIRKAAIEALKGSGMRFSNLLASSDLDYDHDAGHFYYHLSELMDKRIVEKVGDAYRLTEFGQNVAEMLGSLKKECSFLFAERDKGGEKRMDTQSLETEWIEFGREVGFRKRTEKGLMSAGFHSTTNSLQEAISEDLPDGPERAKLYGFLEKLWKGPATLLVKGKDIPFGWATVEPNVSWGSSTDGEKEKSKRSPCQDNDHH